MPYIKPKEREKFENNLILLMKNLEDAGSHKGNLNYCITYLVIGYIKGKGKSYNTLSDITGILNDVKTEFERKIVAPYEDKKIEENGGIY